MIYLLLIVAPMIGMFSLMGLIAIYRISNSFKEMRANTILDRRVKKSGLKVIQGGKADTAIYKSRKNI